MALALVTGSAHSEVSTATTLFGPDASSWAFLKDDPGEAILKDVVANLDQPATIRYGYQRINDVFKGAAIEPDPEQRRDGFQVLMQVNETWKVYDSADESIAPYYMPASGHVVLRFPTDVFVTAAKTQNFARRVLGAAGRGTTPTLEDSIAPLIQGITALAPD